MLVSGKGSQEDLGLLFFKMEILLEFPLFSNATLYLVKPKWLPMLFIYIKKLLLSQATVTCETAFCFKQTNKKRDDFRTSIKVTVIHS